jgi:NADH-quinone oxidoreductase subunit L
MAFALIVLAIGSVFAGYIGVPAAIGGNNWIETFLHSAFLPPGAPHEAAVVHADTSMELLLMGMSVGLAAAGIGIAMYFWLRNPAAADVWSTRFSGLYTLLYNKYYVDEIYGWLFVDGFAKGGGTALSRFDSKVVDGGVNGAGWLTRATSTVSIWWDTWIVDGTVRLTAFLVKFASYPMRMLETGLVQNYALFTVAGVLVILGYYMFQ